MPDLNGTRQCEASAPATEVQRLCVERDEWAARADAYRRASEAQGREIAAPQRGLARVRDLVEATPEEWGEARSILGGTHSNDAVVIAAVTLARAPLARAGTVGSGE